MVLWLLVLRGSFFSSFYDVLEKYSVLGSKTSRPESDRDVIGASPERGVNGWYIIAWEMRGEKELNICLKNGLRTCRVYNYEYDRTPW